MLRAPHSEPADRDVAYVASRQLFKFLRFPLRRRKTANIDKKYQTFLYRLLSYTEWQTSSRPASTEEIGTSRHAYLPIPTYKSKFSSSRKEERLSLVVRELSHVFKISTRSCLRLPADFLIIEGLATRVAHRSVWCSAARPQPPSMHMNTKRDKGDKLVGT